MRSFRQPKGFALQATTVLAGLFLLEGCGMQYTRHVVEGFHEEKLTEKSFALTPLPQIKYQEPGGCFGKGSSDGSKYQGMWDDNILKSLETTHPKNKFTRVEEESLKSLGVNYLALQSAAEKALQDLSVDQIDLSQNNPLKVELAVNASRQHREEIARFNQEGFDFVIVPIFPEMHGEVSTTTTMGANGAMSTSSSTTYYSDLQFVVFSAATGDPIYASGVLASSGGMCFIPPQETTVKASGKQLAKRISDLVTKVLALPAQPPSLASAFGN
jgi:hypothetical protein